MSVWRHRDTHQHGQQVGSYIFTSRCADSLLACRAKPPACGNPFGLRTWIEYGFTHAKDELGWADDRLTDAAAMARWWEIVRCAATVVSLQRPDLAQPEAALTADETPTTPIQTHPQWDHGQGWKPQLNNLRLVLQPFICIICPCLLLPWLHLIPLIPLPQLHDGLCGRSALINTVRSLVPT